MTKELGTRLTRLEARAPRPFIDTGAAGRNAVRKLLPELDDSPLEPEGGAVAVNVAEAQAAREWVYKKLLPEIHGSDN